jgi:hypothetical protein
MKEALSSSETSVRTRVTRRNIPEDAILLKRHTFQELRSMELVNQILGLLLYSMNIAGVNLSCYGYFKKRVDVSEESSASSTLPRPEDHGPAPQRAVAHAASCL